MKRILPLALLGLLAASNAAAQEATYYNFQDLKVLDLDGDYSAVWGSVTSVSRNGRYAVGSDWNLTYHSWVWTSAPDSEERGTYISTGENPATNLVLGISDEGTAVGSFYDETKFKVVPGYRTIDGEWKALPQPAYAQTANQSWMKGQYNDAGLPYIPTAYFISSDGKHIGGWTYAAGGSDDDRPGFDAKLHGFFWHKNDAGVYELEDFADMDLSQTQQGFRPYAMNNEGTIMAGLVQREDNGLFEPAAIIDGQLCVIIEATAGDFSEAAEKGTDEGSCFAVSGRNIYGYATFSQYDEDEMVEIGSEELYSFRYNADTKQLDKLPGLCVKVANEAGQSIAIDPDNGNVYIVENDFVTLHKLDVPGFISDINSASEDFSVLGGISQRLEDYGPVNTPCLIQYSEPNVVVSVGNALNTPATHGSSFDLLGRISHSRTVTGICIEDGKKIIK